jgi:hypothetical protein
MKVEMMRKFGRFPLILILFLVSVSTIAQNSSDSLTDNKKNQILNRLKNFSFGFYVDVYNNRTINGAHDTSNIIPFSSNCPIQNQVRLNVAAFELYYNAAKVRGKFAIQYGDAPNLMASPSSQWIKTIRQANFGFNIAKDIWIDLGYIFNPVGYESSWGALNQVSFVTVGGYFEPGSVLGAKLSCRFSEKFSGGIMAGNPFSIAYSQNTHVAGILFLTYQPLPNLSLNYNNFFGNQALKNAQIENNILYNNLIVKYDPGKHVQLVGQLDFAAQSNSQMAPDTTLTATMFSGFLQARYIISHHFFATGRFEFFNDPDGFLSGVNTLTNRGLRTTGFSCSFEYRPVEIGYIRVAYRFLGSYPGSLAFYSNSRDNMQALIFTAGVRF